MFKKTYFSRQAVHERGEILVEDRGVQPIEQIVALLLVLHEQLDVLVYPLVHGNRVLIPRMRMYSQGQRIWPVQKLHIIRQFISDISDSLVQDSVPYTYYH